MDYQTGIWEKYLVTGNWSQSTVRCSFSFFFFFLFTTDNLHEMPSINFLWKINNDKTRNASKGHGYPCLKNLNANCKRWMWRRRMDRRKVGKMPANMSIFHAGGIYRQILVNAGKYWKLAFITLEVRQNPTLSINLWTMSVIGPT